LTSTPSKISISSCNEHDRGGGEFYSLAQSRNTPGGGSLDNRPREVLKEIGKDLVTSPSDFFSVMIEICGSDCRREIEVLAEVLKVEPPPLTIIETLKSLNRKVMLPEQMELELAKLIKKLIDYSELDKSTAYWVIESWALALGVSVSSPKTFSCTWQVKVEVRTDLDADKWEKAGEWETLDSTPGVINIPPYHDYKLVPQNMDSECFPIWVQHLDVASEIEYLDLSGQDITDDALASLEKFRKLEWLDLSATEITNKGISNLLVLRGLKHLYLNNCHWITDEGLEKLSRLENLRSLHLAKNPTLSNKGLRFLKRMSQLIQLDLSEMGIKNAALFAIEGMPFLEDLDVSYTDITDGALASLRTFPRLEKISLAGCRKVSNDGIAHLQAVGSLRDLNLSETGITDEGINYLERLKLTKLRVWGCWGIKDKALKPFGAIKIIGR